MDTPDNVILQEELDQFTGTEEWYRHSLNTRFLWTDGVRHFAKAAKAHWLIDEIALGFEPRLRKAKETFAVIVLKVLEDRSASIVMTDDLPANVQYHKQRISMTDAPTGEWKFYLCFDGEHAVLMVPSEY